MAAPPIEIKQGLAECVMRIANEQAAFEVSLLTDETGEIHVGRNPLKYF